MDPNKKRGRPKKTLLDKVVEKLETLPRNAATEAVHKELEALRDSMISINAEFIDGGENKIKRIMERFRKAAKNMTSDQVTGATATPPSFSSQPRVDQTMRRTPSTNSRGSRGSGRSSATTSAVPGRTAQTGSNKRQNTGAHTQGAQSMTRKPTEKEREIEMRMKADEDLSLIEIGTARLNEEENDVLHDTGVQVDVEENRMMEPPKIQPMSDAERELENWHNTHVIGRATALQVLRRAMAHRTPALEFTSEEEREKAIEYLARSLQEVLSSMLPEVISIARHRHCDLIEVGDLDAFRNVTRSLPNKLDGLLHDTILKLHSIETERTQ